MLLINCVKGVKVTTTGDTFHGTRTSSTCCNAEKSKGYLIIDNSSKTAIGVITDSRRTSPIAYFNLDQIHPYGGDAYVKS